MHRLHRATDRVAVVIGIVLGEAAARLHAVGRDPVDHGFAPDNALGPSEGCFDRRLIPGFVEERLIARPLNTPRSSNSTAVRGFLGEDLMPGVLEGISHTAPVRPYAR
jgi:hypothetical protein